MAPNATGLGSRRATRPGPVAPHPMYLHPMYLSYEDEPAPVRRSTAQIWRDCARSCAIWTAAYTVAAAVGLTLQALGYLLPRLPMS